MRTSVADRRTARCRWSDHRGPVCGAAGELRNVGVVKNGCSARPRRGGPAVAPSADGRTRDRVAQLLLEQGAATAAELGAALGLSPAGDPPAPRRHARRRRRGGPGAAARGQRGRGRPAKVVRADRRRPGALPAHLRRPGHRRAALDRRARRPGGGRARSPPSQVAGARGALPGGDGERRRRPDRPGRGARRGADRRGLRCQRDDDRLRRAAVPAPLPGGPRRRRVPAAVRGRDPGDLPPGRHPRAAARHHRQRRRGVHHAHPDPRPRSRSPPPL